MKYIKLTLLFLSVSLVTWGCNPMATPDENYSNHLNVDEFRPDNQVDSDQNDILGFVHYRAENMDEFTDSRNFIGVDRVQTADMITRRVLLSAHFNEVATLVTDKEIIVAYDLGADLEPDMGRDIAEKTAASFVPGFYEIYVTADRDHIDRIQQIHLSSAQNQLNNSEIEKLIKNINDQR